MNFNLEKQEHPKAVPVTVINTATVKATQMPLITTTSTLLVYASSDLMVTQATNKPTGVVGEHLTYITTISNNGPSPSTEVILNDILPENCVLVSTKLESMPSPLQSIFKETITLFIEAKTVPNYHYSNGQLTWYLGDLSSDATLIVTIIITPTAPGSFKNFTWVVGGEHDPNISNNIFTETTTITPSRSRGIDFF